MSWLALDWAENAPVADAYERAILTKMAARAGMDGTGVWLSQVTLARHAVCDKQTVKDRMKAMSERGLIAPGDQRRAAHLPANRRPVVYDLMIPASHYSPSQFTAMQRERDDEGRGPFPVDLRPDLPDTAPPRVGVGEGGARKMRKDAGIPRPQMRADEQPVTWDDAQGGLGDTPVSEPGGSTKPPQGGLGDTPGGVYETPNTFSKKPSGETFRGGEVGPEGHQRVRAAAAATAAPPPPSSLRPERGKPETWKCGYHLANPLPPGAEEKPCRACKTERERCAGRETELKAAGEAIEAEKRRRCTWHDEGRWVIDPETGIPFEPAVKCDCETTSPESIRARRVAATPDAPAPSQPSAAQQEAMRLARKRPAAVVSSRVGWRTTASARVIPPRTSEAGTSGLDADGSAVCHNPAVAS